MHKKAIAIIAAASIALSGCATSSSNIAASYTTPMQYQSYDCAQLIAEAQRVQARVNQLAGRLDEAANNDKVLMGVGLVLFWPALFALGGTKQQEADFARLKGEYDAIQQAMIARKCEQQALPGTASVGSGAQAAPLPASTAVAPVTSVPSSDGALSR